MSWGSLILGFKKSYFSENFIYYVNSIFFTKNKNCVFGYTDRLKTIFGVENQYDKIDKHFDG